MALQYRKLVRDTYLALLAENFNSTLVGMAATYGLSNLPVLDFSPESTNFAVSRIDEANIETCQIEWAPGMYLGGCLYTSDVIDDGEPHALSFSGRLFAHVDFFIRWRQGVEGFDTESLSDAVEDAVLTILKDSVGTSNAWPPGVLFQRKSEMQRGAVIPLSDGWAVKVPIKSLFRVVVN